MFRVSRFTFPTKELFSERPIEEVRRKEGRQGLLGGLLFSRARRIVADDSASTIYPRSHSFGFISLIMAKIKLLETFNSATEDDLAAVTAEIESKEKARDAAVAELDKEISGLKALHKMLDVRLHGKRPKAKRAARAGVGSGGAARASGLSPAQEKAAERGDILNKVYDLVSKEGSMPMPAIAERIGISPYRINRAMENCDWFNYRNGEVVIARKKG